MAAEANTTTEHPIASREVEMDPKTGQDILKASPKVRNQTLATIALSVIPLFIVYKMWPALEYPPQFVVFVFLFSLLPLFVQLSLWSYRRARLPRPETVLPPHPASLVLPLALLLVLPLWPAGDWIARHVPSLCATVAGERVMTSRPGTGSGKGSFY